MSRRPRPQHEPQKPHKHIRNKRIRPTWIPDWIDDWESALIEPSAPTASLCVRAIWPSPLGRFSPMATSAAAIRNELYQLHRRTIGERHFSKNRPVPDRSVPPIV